MKSQTVRNPTAGVIFLLSLLFIIWVVDLTFGLPINVLRAAILATIFSSLAVTL